MFAHGLLVSINYIVIPTRFDCGFQYDIIKTFIILHINRGRPWSYNCAGLPMYDYTLVGYTMSTCGLHDITGMIKKIKNSKGK